MYYTNITYEEAVNVKGKLKIFVWDERDKDYQEGQYPVTFNHTMADKVDETCYYVDINELTYLNNNN